MRTLTFSLFAILVLLLVTQCSRDPVAPDLADPGSLDLAADETPRGLLALINRLERERGLTHRQADWLRERLKEAVRFEDAGRPEKAERVFEDMIQQVGKWRNQGQVTTIVADEIITYLQGVLGNRFASISSGRFHTCGLRPSGTAYCWGDNFGGELGNGTTSNSDVPVKVVGGHKFASISAGNFHTCGLTPAGTAYCWGSNIDGQLGNGTYSSSKIPVVVVGGHTFALISAGGGGGGFGQTCGVTTAGAGYCWGDNDNGELGNGTNTGSNFPVLVAGEHTFASISTGSTHTCGVTTGGPRGGFGAGYCWGSNDDGRLGNGTNTDSNVPVPVVGGHTFASISAGKWHSCGVTTAAVGYCWGNNDTGQLGNGTNISIAAPGAVAGGHKFASISEGDYYTCAVTTAGSSYCWGANYYGQLGDGTENDSNVPVAVAGAYTFAAISAGGYHACGVTISEAAYCWGNGQDGQLGNGTNWYSNVPVSVAKP